MRCAWSSFIGLLPQWMRCQVDKLGKDSLQELRLRIHRPPELIGNSVNFQLERPTTIDDLQFCINTASRYSPWSARTSRFGYITAPGGHRIGLCGQVSVSGIDVTGISSVTSLCLRVARDFEGIGMKASSIKGSLLIIGKPGSGKTTLIRDVIRCRSDILNQNIAVVDEKGEIFPNINGQMCFPPGNRTDVISGCRKAQGIDAVLRNMGPDVIAVDEITAQEDCESLVKAGWCGVDLIATAHARSKIEFLTRTVYRPLTDAKLFDTLLVLRDDKTWYTERMN